MWKTSIGRVVATRHLHTQGGRGGHSPGGHVEIRIVLPLPEDDGAAVGLMRRVIVAAYYVISKVASATKS